MREEGDVTGIVESDNGIYVAKLTSNLDREATDAKRNLIHCEEKEQEQYDSSWTVEKRYKDNRTWKSGMEKVKFEKQGVIIVQNEEEGADE